MLLEPESLVQRGSTFHYSFRIAIDLESLGFQSFNELLPYLERLEEADLAQRLPQSDAIAFRYNG